MVLNRFVLSFAATLAAASIAVGQQAELLSFHLPTCGPCHAMAPTVDRLESAGVRVRRVNGAHETDLASRLQVTSYPTFVAVADGREIGRIVGATSYDQLRQLLTVANPPPTAPPSRRTFAATSGRGESLARVGGDWGAGRPAPTPPAQQPVASPSHAQLLQRSVRLTIDDGVSRSFGTGTIVDARSGEALVVTCAHLFRDENRQPIDVSGKLMIELFDTAGGTVRVAERVEGQLVAHDFEADVALVAIRPSGVVPTAPVAASPGGVRIGDAVSSVGCDLGADPTVRDSRVVDLNRYTGPPNIEASGAPVQGRSGGGLFDASGRLVGVCNFADEAADEGIYAGLASIHTQLDRIGLTALYREAPSTAPAAGQGGLAADTAAPAPSAAALAPVPRAPIVRGQNAIAPAANPLTPTEQATFDEIVSRGGRSEVVVLIRPDTTGGQTEVLTLDAASPEFVAALRRLTPAR